MSHEHNTGDLIAISEIFGPTVQGEGPYAGELTMFVRTGGCDFKCRWCDSMHAVDPVNAPSWGKMRSLDIVVELRRLWASNSKVPSLTLSGGNPAIWSGLGMLADAWPGKVRLETQGTIVPPWLASIDTVIVSPKPPSSGENGTARLEHFLSRIPNSCEVAFKVPVASEDDLDWALNMYADYARGDEALYINPVNEVALDWDANMLVQKWLEIVGWVQARRATHVRVGHQQHVLAWGNKNGV